MLEARGLSVAFGGREIVRTIDLHVGEGEFVCIVGPSGCGKTTLLRLLAGLVSPSAGEVRFKGRPVDKPQPRIALVFQDYGRALLPWRTVRGNVAFALEARDMPSREFDSRIDALLDKMNLRDAADKFPAQLSGGMQQRVQIARCLAQEPELLLMDEPFGSLDALTRQQLQDEAARIARDDGRAVLFVTHDLEEAIYLGDRVVVLAAHPGRVAETVSIDLPRPRNQLSTREDARFLEYRHRLYRHLAH